MKILKILGQRVNKDFIYRDWKVLRIQGSEILKTRILIVTDKLP